VDNRTKASSVRKDALMCVETGSYIHSKVTFPCAKQHLSFLDLCSREG